MFICDKLKEKKPLISFEIFPPKKEFPIDTIYQTIDDLVNINPDFISVTYGAGGSTKDNTVDIASYITEKYNLSALAHLTCLTSTKEDIENTLGALKEKGVKNILALRGDYPQNASPEDFQNPKYYKSSIDLIEHIKQYGDFCVGGACYPEKHPEAKSEEDDLLFLKRKVEAGADFLITQLFFDNEIFYRFMEQTQKYNINVPVLAGILPVLNKNQVEKIVSLTGCKMPEKFLRILSKYEHSPESLAEAGLAYAKEQMIDLLSWGIDGIHLYTMNKPAPTKEIISGLTTIRGFLNTKA
ncbi:methylenetetrahydrofolate reductase [NAD(P)H] [Desulfuribacillus stibiiarsenatis]|uniref:Methylenetetrahydrofolate reductase n=1 Tax=Desulfuribacillus stibiiarsenatis TaxID=1390249 RepID=A0A1E5L8J6_9FIRM|nr:methylenetetrahydrofolate reductase [NAD(P)H] [Desulfuribacillus stibiiarsenatis]OEH86446.1 methylenetetrahydrofolate reductase [NAD(P)H] [Desulfuribacillus stibiiarsenatis]